MAWIDAVVASRTAELEGAGWSPVRRPAVVAPLRTSGGRWGATVRHAGSWRALAFGLSILTHAAAVMLVLPNRSVSFVVPAETSFELVFEPAPIPAPEPSQDDQPEQPPLAAPVIPPLTAAAAPPEPAVPAETASPLTEEPPPPPQQAVRPAAEPPPSSQAVRPSVEPPQMTRRAARVARGNPHNRQAEPQFRPGGAAAEHAVPAPLIPPSPVAGMESNHPPTYPAAALRRGEQGRVLVRVSVSADGMPVAVDLAQSSGYASLDGAALTAVRGWRFNPATRAGQPVPAVAELPVQFRLAN